MALTQVITFERVAGGESWTNVAAAVDTWLQANADIWIRDVWTDRHADQDRIRVHILYETVTPGTEPGLAYRAKFSANAGGAANFPTWFATQVDANYNTEMPVYILNVSSFESGDIYTNLAFFYIVVDLGTDQDRAGGPTEVFVGSPQANIAALGAGTVNLFASNGLFVSAEQVTNLSSAAIWEQDKKSYVVADPITKRLVAIPNPCAPVP